VSIPSVIVVTQRPSLPGADVPVRVYDDGLMDQLETAFGLADGFDRERPDVHRLIGMQLDVYAEPFVSKA